MRAVIHDACFLMLRGCWRVTKRLLPRVIRRRIEGSPSALRARRLLGPTKCEAELRFWRDQYRRHAGNIRNDAYYQNLMMQVAGLDDDSLFQDKVVADIGCGPRGSLCWMNRARMKIGIDPLVDAYREFKIAGHEMLYVAGRGEDIPFADRSVDVVVTVNALDHVDEVRRVMSEIRRILKPGGTFVGSIGMREIPTATEPATITMELVRSCLLQNWLVRYEHVFPECDVPDDAYRYAHQPAPAGYKAEMNVLWCRAEVPRE